MLKTTLPLVLALVLAGCGNKGPLVLAPPAAEEDAALMQAAAVDDAGALADPTPADTEALPLPPDNPPVEAEPDPVPDDSTG